MDKIRWVAVVGCATNGLKGSVIRTDILFAGVHPNNGRVSHIEADVRYYYPAEELNWKSAMHHHHLDEELITTHRIGKKWPKYFIDDADRFRNDLANAEMILAFNLKFASSKLQLDSFANAFCVMEENLDILCIPDKFGRKHKLPSLAETAWHYDVSYTPEYHCHPLYNVRASLKIYLAMLGRESSREVALSPWLA